jgi:ABC-2 type transport system permease protein
MGVGLLAIGAVVFYSFDVWDLGFGLVPIAAVLLAVGWCISLLVIGIVLRFGAGAEALAWGVMFVVMPLSGVFYPLDALPAALQPVALALPTTHAFAALRELVDGHGVDWGQIGIAAAETVVLAILALWFLVRMLAIFRRRGYITRYT